VDEAVVLEVFGATKATLAGGAPLLRSPNRLASRPQVRNVTAPSSTRLKRPDRAGTRQEGRPAQPA
jgi:hypothetical protein